MLLIEYLVKFERHCTKTHHEKSIAKKLIIVLIKWLVPIFEFFAFDFAG